MKPKAISLFCGAGGCSLGFKKAGYDIVFATDIDKTAVKTYKSNFPNTPCIQSDITELDFYSIAKEYNINSKNLDIVIGGPPCQGFSTAGLRFWDDPRNELLKSYINALSILKPKWFLMENVEGLLTSNKGKYIYEAAKAFIELGYRIRIEKIYAQEYGIPQRRKRVFIIGNRLGIDFHMPEPTVKIKGQIFRNSDITLYHAINTLPSPNTNPNAIYTYENTANDLWEEQLRGDSKIITDHYIPNINELQLKRIKYLKPGDTMKNLPPELQHDSFKKRANRRVMDGTPSEKRGGSPSGLKRLYYNEPSLTITGASTREFIHPIQDRPLTIRESARIQTFPDDFKFSGNSSQKIQQIGNAIPPYLARIFAEHIKEEFGFHLNEINNGILLGFVLTKADAMSPALQRTHNLLDELTMNIFNYQKAGAI